MSSADSAADRVVRPITDDERAEYWNTMNMAFHVEESDEGRDIFLGELTLDRTFAAFEGTELVGTGGAFAFRMTVPGGGAVRAAGLTGISVKPTERRRGVLSAMLRTHLDALHEAGDEPLAVLQASEPRIYGRFGYALATTGLALSIRRSPDALRAVPGSEKYRIRLAADHDAAFAASLPVYNRAAAQRPGMVSRDEQHKAALLADLADFRDGYGPLRWILAEAPDGTVAGYARYRTKEGGAGYAHRPQGEVKVWDAFGDDLAAYAAVWRYLLDLDLVEEVRTFGRPVDDPLLYLLHDVRAAQPALRDHIYARLVDVDRALAARRYATAVDVVFAVTDPFCPWNDGRYRLSGDAGGAVCERTTAAPDLVLDQHELGAAYLGGTSLAALGRAGLVQELTPGALAATSRAFLSDPAPWMAFGF